MRKYLLCLFAFVFYSTTAVANDGLISLKSAHSVRATADRLENILKEKGMTVFARINHSTGAEKAGLQLRPTELVIFGNPKVGTPLMQCKQSAAIDLPQKALIWQDESGQVWLSYNSPNYLAKRHNIMGCEPIIAKISDALTIFSNAATAP